MESPHVLLCHNPKGFDHAAEIGIPLTLSGHTHGGQIARRNKPDANMAFAHKRSAGLYETGDCRLFVTVGIGAWFPLRMNCPAEVVVITMSSSLSQRLPPDSSSSAGTRRRCPRSRTTGNPRSRRGQRFACEQRPYWHLACFVWRSVHHAYAPKASGEFLSQRRGRTPSGCDREEHAEIPPQLRWNLRMFFSVTTRRGSTTPLR